MTSQAKKHSELSNGHLIRVINHADYPEHLVVAIHPTTGMNEQQLLALAWLCMCCDLDRISALATSSFIDWITDPKPGQLSAHEMEMLIALLSFLDSLAAIDQLS